MIPGTEELIGDDLLEGPSWTIGVMLLNTSGVGLLSCVSIVFVLHLPTGKCTCDKRTRSCLKDK